MKNPEIRFIDDNIDWEEKKLGELNNLSVPTIYKNYYLEIGDIKPLSNSYILDKTKKIVSGAKLATNGTILVSTVRPTRGAICKLKDGNMFVSSALYQFNSNNEFLNDIILQQLQTYKFLKYCGDNCEGGTYPTISKENIDKFIVKTPKNVEKISKTLTSIDVKIINQTAIIEKLYNTKSALLIKMFPQENQSIPELRFDGFTDTWEQRKLKDITQITMGQSPDGNTYSEQPNKYILVQGNADLQNGWVYPRIWTSQMTKKAEKGDLIMSVRAPAGSIGKTAYDVVIGRGVAAIKGNEFLYQSLVKMDIGGYWKKIACGSTFESINSDDIRDAEIFIPNNKEQFCIGKLFTTLDHLITLHQRKLDKLKEVKAALLEKLLV